MNSRADFLRTLTTGGDKRLTPARPDLAAGHLQGIVEAAAYTEGTSFKVTAFSCPLCSEPAGNGPLATELLYGEIFEVYEEADGWAWGQAERDFYVGYAPLEGLAPAPEAGAGDRCTVTAPLIDSYREPDIKARRLASYPMHAVLRLKGRKRTGDYDFLELEEGGFVRADLVWEQDPERTPWPYGSDYVDLAHAFMGAPYRWGGRTAMGLDCSGLLQNIGVAILRDTDLQEREMALAGEEIASAPYRRGDIVFFPGHVGVMVDPDNLLHANARAMRVSVDRLETVLDYISRKEGHTLGAVYRFPDGPRLEAGKMFG